MSDDFDKNDDMSWLDDDDNQPDDAPSSGDETPEGDDFDWDAMMGGDADDDDGAARPDSDDLGFTGMLDWRQQGTDDDGEPIGDDEDDDFGLNWGTGASDETGEPDPDSPLGITGMLDWRQDDSDDDIEDDLLTDTGSLRPGEVDLDALEGSTGITGAIDEDDDLSFLDDLESNDDSSSGDLSFLDDLKSDDDSESLRPGEIDLDELEQSTGITSALDEDSEEYDFLADLTADTVPDSSDFVDEPEAADSDDFFAELMDDDDSSDDFADADDFDPMQFLDSTDDDADEYEDDDEGLRPGEVDLDAMAGSTGITGEIEAITDEDMSFLNDLEDAQPPSRRPGEVDLDDLIGSTGITGEIEAADMDELDFLDDLEGDRGPGTGDSGLDFLDDFTDSDTDDDALELEEVSADDLFDFTADDDDPAVDPDDLFGAGDADNLFTALDDDDAANDPFADSSEGAADAFLASLMAEDAPEDDEAEDGFTFEDPAAAMAMDEDLFAGLTTDDLFAEEEGDDFDPDATVLDLETDEEADDSFLEDLAALDAAADEAPAEAPYQDLDSLLASLDDGEEVQLPDTGALDDTDVNLDDDFFADLDADIADQAERDEAADRPDFLRDVEVGGDVLSAAAILRQRDNKPDDELDERLYDLQQRGRQSQERTSTTDSDELFPDVPDAVPAANFSFEAEEIASGLRLNPQQERDVDTLREMVGTDGIPLGGQAAVATTLEGGALDPDDFVDPSEEEARRSERRARRRRRQQRNRNLQVIVQRALVAALLFLVVLLPLFGIGLFGDPPPSEFAEESAAAAVFENIGILPEGERVLFAVEYGPTGAAELDPMLRATVRHVLSEDGVPVFIGSNPVGMGRVESLMSQINVKALDEGIVDALPIFNEDYYITRFLTGGAVGLRNLAEAPQPFMATNVRGEPTNLNIGSLDEFGLIVVLAERPENVRFWIEQVAPVTDTPLVAGVGQAAEPLARQYLNLADGLNGLLVGITDAVVYDNLLTDVLIAQIPTVTPTPTDAPPTFTPTATHTPTPGVTAFGLITVPAQADIGEGEGVIISEGPADLRAAPATNGRIIGSVAPDSTLPVRSFESVGDLLWVQTRLEDGRTAFISGDDILVNVFPTGEFPFELPDDAFAVDDAATDEPLPPAEQLVLAPEAGEGAFSVPADGIVVRGNADANSSANTVLAAGSSLPITGQAIVGDTLWFQVRLPDGTTGFVNGLDVEVSNLPAGLPIIEVTVPATQIAGVATETPAATPTATLTPTATATATSTPTFTPTSTPTITPSITLTPSNTPTPTNTLTPSITPTPSNTPEFTPTPTFTPTSTFTPTPTPVLLDEGTVVETSSRVAINVRSGPGINFTPLSAAPPRSRLLVVGNSEDGQWAEVRLATGDTGFVFRELITVIEDGEEPTLAPTETPSEVPSETPTVTPSVTPIPLDADGLVVVITSRLPVNIRELPNRLSNSLGPLNRGAALALLGATDDERWLEVQLPDGRTGFIIAGAADVIPGETYIELATATAEAGGEAAPLPQSPTPAPTFDPDVESEAAASDPQRRELPGGTVAQVRGIENLNVRQGPSRAAPIVGRLTGRQRVPALALSTDEQWVLVRLPATNREGWVSARLLYVFAPEAHERRTMSRPRIDNAERVRRGLFQQQESPGEGEIIATGSANVRQGPSLAFGIAGAVEPGDVVPVLAVVTEDGQDWVQIELPDGSNGFVQANLIDITTPPGDPAPTNTPAGGFDTTGEGSGFVVGDGPADVLDFPAEDGTVLQTLQPGGRVILRGFVSVNDAAARFAVVRLPDNTIGYVDETRVQVANAPTLQATVPPRIDTEGEGSGTVIGDEPVAVLDFPAEDAAAITSLEPGDSVILRGFVSNDVNVAYAVVRLPNNEIGYVDGIQIEINEIPTIEVAFPTREGEAVAQVPTATPFPSETPPPPTATLRPTATLPPSATPAFSTGEPGTVIASAPLNVRAEPTLFGDVVGQAQPGDEVTLLNQSADGVWYEITTPDGVTGFVQAISIEVGAAPAQPTEIAAATLEAQLALRFANVTAASAVNVRSGPGLEFGVVGAANPDETLPVLAISDDGLWVQVSLVNLGVDGWLDANTVEIVETPVRLGETETPTPPALAQANERTAEIIAPGVVNVRSGPGLEFGVAGAAAPGEVLPVLAVSDDGLWVQIRLQDGTEGWLDANTVTITEPATETPSETPTLMPTATEQLAQVEGGTPIAEATGGVQRALTVPAEETAALIGDTPLPVYSGPDVLFNVLGPLNPGQEVVGLGPTDDGAWYTFRYPTTGEVGYIQAENVAVSAPADAVQRPYLAVTGLANNPAYAEPDTAAEVLGTYPQDAQFVVFEVVDDGAWYEVRLPDGRLGYIEGSIANVTGDLPGPTFPAASAPAPVTVRSQPNDSAAPVGQIAPDVVVDALGFSDDSAWVQVRLPDGQRGFAPFEAVNIVRGDVAETVIGGGETLAAGGAESTNQTQIGSARVPLFGPFYAENPRQVDTSSERQIFAVRLGLIASAILILISNIFYAVRGIRQQREGS